MKPTGTDIGCVFPDTALAVVLLLNVQAAAVGCLPRVGTAVADKTGELWAFATLV